MNSRLIQTLHQMYKKKNKNIDPLYGVFAVSLGTINIIDVIVTEFGIYCVADEAH